MVPDIGEKRKKYMKRKIIYTDPPPDIAESLDRAVIIEDFLPPPSELILAAYPQNSSAVKKRLSSTYKKKEVEYV